MEHCRVNAFNLGPVQLISLALHVFYDCINSSLCRWAEDQLPFPCSKGFKAVRALARCWKIRGEKSSFFIDKHSKLSPWALPVLRKNMEEMQHCRRSQCSHRLPEFLTPRQQSKKVTAEACMWQVFEWRGATKQAMTGSTHCQGPSFMTKTMALEFPCSTKWTQAWKKLSGGKWHSLWRWCIGNERASMGLHVPASISFPSLPGMWFRQLL